MAKKRLFTGLQPSGALHIGNYFGALRPFLDTYQEYDSMLMVADYHSLTSLKDPKALRENIMEIVRAYLAIGVDPQKAVIFKQSDVPEHTELAWILECQVTVPFLMQAHAYKDKVAKGLEANAGLFSYPVLMASDILLYSTDVVPVGKDQQQHVEYAREAASKFNLAYGETFKEPKEVILESVATVPGTDGEKMSKSYKNTIPLFGSKEEITKAVMGIVTNSTGEIPQTVHNIHELVKEIIVPDFKESKASEDFFDFYRANKASHNILKEALAEDLETMIAPMRSRYAAISDDEIKTVLKNGAEKAKGLAAAKMREVREKVGVTI